MKNKTWNKEKLDGRKYNVTALNKFMNYILDQNGYREGIDSEANYRKQIMNDPVFMEIIEHCQEKAVKEGPRKKISVPKLKVQMEAYTEEWPTVHRVPSITGFCVDYASPKMSESRLYQVLDEHEADSELLESHREIIALRKFVIDTGAIVGKFDGRYVKEAMRQADVDQPWDSDAKNLEIDGKKGFAQLVRDAFS